MKPVEDIDHHLICYVDAKTGVLENRFQKQIIRIHLPKNGIVDITRRGNLTQIRRTEDGRFYVNSVRVPAYADTNLII